VSPARGRGRPGSSGAPEPEHWAREAWAPQDAEDEEDEEDEEAMMSRAERAIDTRLATIERRRRQAARKEPSPSPPPSSSRAPEDSSGRRRRQPMAAADVHSPDRPAPRLLERDLASSDFAPDSEYAVAEEDPGHRRHHEPVSVDERLMQRYEAAAAGQGGGGGDQDWYWQGENTFHPITAAELNRRHAAAAAARHPHPELAPPPPHGVGEPAALWSAAPGRDGKHSVLERARGYLRERAGLPPSVQVRGGRPFLLCSQRPSGAGRGGAFFPPPFLPPPLGVAGVIC
jgi:hypothetical protein